MAKKSKSAGNAGTEVKGVDLSEVKRLLAFMQEHGLEEFEYERRGVHIRLKKSSGDAGSSGGHAVGAAAAVVAPASGESSVGATPQASSEAPADNTHVIKSPIVGTFYAAASPEGDPFVTLGARVETSQVLCIIEAMKLMNEIESDVAGEVVRIFVENGHPVEYGEPLFGIRVHGKGKK